MNSKNETLIQFKPSQLINLPVFVFGIIFIPCLFLLNDLIKLYLPSGLIPQQTGSFVLKSPFFLALVYVLYLGYHILKVCCIRYEISPEELRCYSGILYRKHDFLELYRAKDYRVDRPLIYRIFGLGNLTIYTSDKTTPVLKMEAIPNPQNIYKTLRALVEQNRKTKHVFEVD